MNAATIIFMCILVSSFLLLGSVAAIIKLIDLGLFMGRMEQRMETLTQRAAEDRKRDGEKFDTLYNNRNEQDRRLVKVETQLEPISAGMKEIRKIVEKISGKIDEFAQRTAGA